MAILYRHPKVPGKVPWGLTTMCGEYARIKEQSSNLEAKQNAIEAVLSYQERSADGLVLQDPWLNRWPQEQWTGSMCGLSRETGVRNLRQELRGGMDLGC